MSRPDAAGLRVLAGCRFWRASTWQLGEAGTVQLRPWPNGTPYFYVDAATNTINAWATDFVTGWKQTFFYGNTVAAGSSPSAGVLGG